ncbi:MAG: leucine dehydrogenase, partial [Deltaproteobacteria bacterium]|nr:leucine dehydrogenase [Deltaproteobacteria bacterium]
MELLLNSGARVLFTEVDESLVKLYRSKFGLEYVPPGAVYDTVSPCAIGGILTPETASRIKCKAIVGGANNQLSSPDVARIMEKRSVLYAPDYVVNVGGAMAILGMETQGWSKERAEEEVALAVR